MIKVIWGDDWDRLIENDISGLLLKRMEEVVDGEMLKYIVEGGEYIRRNFFGKYVELEELVKDYTDKELHDLRSGGHDPEKMYAAYYEATRHKGQPTVILARTIKGYGLGEAGEGRNITHQQKKLNENELLYFRDRFEVPLSNSQASNAPFYRFKKGSREQKYIIKKRENLGGFLPSRKRRTNTFSMPDIAIFKELISGMEGREVSTTMVFVRLLTLLCKDNTIGKYVVPIIPDEARTFGMDPLFRQLGIYTHLGQLYDPCLLYTSDAADE